MNANAVPRVVIIGGGFAGLTVAKALRNAPVAITLLDRQNHHLFQPLLYQVATGALNPSDIASPIRRILRNQRNVEVLLADVTSIDTDSRTVHVGEGDGESGRSTTTLPPAPSAATARLPELSQSLAARSRPGTAAPAS